MKILKAAIIVMVLLLVTITGRAAGDPPIRMNAEQSRISFNAVRDLLIVDGQPCPPGQDPVSGSRSGGSSPESGTEIITLAFSKGAHVIILKTWDSLSERDQVNVQVKCSLK